MNVAAGTRLGPYDIIAPIGAGGMGEVFRARDRRLERDVAIKILPEHLSSNAQFRERFDREAKAISQLNHPHICTLHDIGHEDGTSYLVMELLEGQSLADRLSKGPLPLEQVLRFGAQIANALDRAHRQGIVHRDLKPGNVMITKSGAKLLDFGLAKSTAADDLFAGATVQKPLTQEGTIMGTFQYMAPEQLEGIEADARSDIFALGAVLYEMATGARAFQGKTKTSLIASIVSGEPAPMSAMQPMTPPSFEHVVQKCLAKDPDDRWQSAHDIAEELRWIGEAGSQGAIAAPFVAKRKRRDRVLLTVAIAGLLATVILGYLLWRARTQTLPTIRAAIVSPPATRFEYSRIDSAALTLSPDGRYVTFAASNEKRQTMLWLRALDSEKAQPLSGTEGAKAPFWSPDSRTIGFFSGGKLKRMDIGGGPPVNLADASDGRGGSWSNDGVIIYEPDWRQPIHRVPANGGAATVVTKLDESQSETTHRWPWFLPDGKHFLYLAGSHRVAQTSDLNAIYAGSIDSPERKLLLRARSNAVYANGFLFFVRENSLLAQRFDPGKLALQGDPIRVAEAVTYDSGFFRGSFAAAEDGTLVYFTGSPNANTQLAWYDRGGKRVSPIGPPSAALSGDVFQSLRLSPDGSRLALEMGDTADIWILDLARGTRTRFTSDPMNDISPVWSPDGSSIVYANDRDVLFAIHQKSTNGLGRETPVLKGPQLLVPKAWSSDGKYLAVDAGDPTDPDAKIDVWVVPMSGDRKPIPFADSEFTEWLGEFSPDVRWLTFVSNESGRFELYAVSFPSKQQKRQLSTDGAISAVWRRDGREILYMMEDRTVMSIAVRGDTFDAPKMLFRPEVPLLAADLTRDGSRILGAESERTAASPMTLVTKWSPNPR